MASEITSTDRIIQIRWSDPAGKWQGWSIPANAEEMDPEEAADQSACFAEEDNLLAAAEALPEWLRRNGAR